MSCAISQQIQIFLFLAGFPVEFSDNRCQFLRKTLAGKRQKMAPSNLDVRKNQRHSTLIQGFCKHLHTYRQLSFIRTPFYPGLTEASMWVRVDVNHKSHVTDIGLDANYQSGPLITQRQTDEYKWTLLQRTFTESNNSQGVSGSITRELPGHR